MLRNIVQKSDPFKKTKCEDSSNCMVCSEDESRGRCRQTGVVYEIKCKSCDNKYIGETNRNGYTRGQEYEREYEKKDKSSVLHKHAIQKHSNDTLLPQFSMNIVSKQPTALGRQITDAVKIANEPIERLINSKQEFGHNKFWRFELAAD